MVQSHTIPILLCLRLSLAASVEDRISIVWRRVRQDIGGEKLMYHVGAARVHC